MLTMTTPISTVNLVDHLPTALAEAAERYFVPDRQYLCYCVILRRQFSSRQYSETAANTPELGLLPAFAILPFASVIHARQKTRRVTVVAISAWTVCVANQTKYGPRNVFVPAVAPTLQKPSFHSFSRAFHQPNAQQTSREKLGESSRSI